MAIDTYINVTIDAGAASKPDRTDHNHRVNRGSANANDLTVAFDKTVVASKNAMQSALAQVMRVLNGGNELT